jgi:hypothetical protein
MNSKTKKVFNGWLGLNDDERRTLATAIREYENSGDSGKRALRESTRDYVMKQDTGPLGSGHCPCCGR